MVDRILQSTISHKVSVSHEEDKEAALSKDVGMHGDVSCAVRRRASQLRRAWFMAANYYAFRQRRAHEISSFYVTFSCTELTRSCPQTLHQ
jgi:hypothetical protein